MYKSFKIFYVLCLSLSLLHLVKTRSLSVSLNLSLTRTELSEPNKTAPKLSHDMLRSCMRETEISMSQLKLFRLSLLSNDYQNNENEGNVAEGGSGTGGGDDNNLGDMDYVGTPQLSFLDLKHNEPLQCFVRCLYERLGLAQSDIILGEAFRMQVQNIIQREKPELKECTDLEGKNRCETAYKLHMCYNQLKSLEAEQRIREVLEHSEAAERESEADKLMSENELNAEDKEGKEDNEESDVLLNGVRHSEEHESENN